MPFIIEVKEVITRVTKRRKWQQVGEGKGENGRDFDYVDDEWPETETCERLRQVVDELDITMVIRAINGL